MSRLPDALLRGEAYSKGSMGKVIDVTYGGENGWVPDYSEIVSATHHTSRQTFCKLIEYPTGFDFLPNPEMWIRALKGIMERQVEKIEGLKATITAEYAESPYGGAGEIFHDPTDVKREASSVSLTIKDKAGRPIQRFFENYILYLIGDPNTKTPLISTLTGDKPFDMLSDRRAFTMLYWESDATGMFVDKAWIGYNQMPKSAGTNESRRDLTSGGTVSELSIELTGTYEYTQGAVALAQQYLNAINFTNARPFMAAPGVTASHPNIEAVGGGFKANVEKLGTTSIRV